MRLSHLNQRFVTCHFARLNRYTYRAHIERVISPHAFMTVGRSAIDNFCGVHRVAIPFSNALGDFTPCVVDTFITGCLAAIPISSKSSLSYRNLPFHWTGVLSGVLVSHPQQKSTTLYATRNSQTSPMVRPSPSPSPEGRSVHLRYAWLTSVLCVALTGTGFAMRLSGRQILISPEGNIAPYECLGTFPRRTALIDILHRWHAISCLLARCLSSSASSAAPLCIEAALDRPILADAGDGRSMPFECPRCSKAVYLCRLSGKTAARLRFASHKLRYLQRWLYLLHLLSDALGDLRRLPVSQRRRPHASAL